MQVQRRIWLVLIVLALLWPTFVSAQDNDWREYTTSHFIILHSPNDSTVAAQYAGFVDDIYEELAAIFSHRTATPLTLRLYPTLESYHAVNPLARNIPGVIAHADFRRREVVVIIPQTRDQSPEEVKNNVRHELAHIIASDMSGNRLNTGFHEGIAQYVEHPTPELERKMYALSVVRDQGRLLSWSDFEDRDKIYQQPEVSYPQALSVVAFLVERYGFAQFREFLTISARSNGYRTALERAYGVSPRELEEQWRDWLPSYIDSGYLRNTGSSYDLTYSQRLLEQGRYAEAQSELERALGLLRATIQGTPDEQQQQMLAEATYLQSRIEQGQRAELLATEARSALEGGNYAYADSLVQEAQRLYAELGDTRQSQVLVAYADRARRGQQADAQLAQAGDALRTLRLLQARANADAALVEFIALGDSQRAQQALSIRHTLDRWQRVAAVVLLAIGIIGLLASFLGRIYWREQEAW